MEDLNIVELSNSRLEVRICLFWQRFDDAWQFLVVSILAMEGFNIVEF